MNKELCSEIFKEFVEVYVFAFIACVVFVLMLKFGLMIFIDRQTNKEADNIDDLAIISCLENHDAFSCEKPIKLRK